MDNPAANLNDFIVAEVHKQTSEPAIQALVEKKIAETVADAVKRSMESYGDVGKQIHKVVANALDIGERLDVPAYGNMVMAVLRSKMDEVLQPLVTEKLAQEMNDILCLAPKKLKLTDVVKAMMSGIEVADRYGTYATCLIEESEYATDYMHIALDPEENVQKYECALQMGVTSTGEIYSLSIDRKDAKTTVRMGYLPDYQKMVFAAYCCGSKFVIDNNEPDTGIGDF
ncbi:hypothetical protein NKJ04_17680 [Mesorhizobium sp. M0618]|uniref:hypothetical protein n=1 Tax=Mesorhizobium sp. M0618 TaxID=2956972 RepID=UPI00333CF840